MKKEIIKNLALPILLGLTIYLCFQNFSLRKEIKLASSSSHVEKVDTIYISKPYKKEKEYSEVSKPEKVIIYQPSGANPSSQPQPQYTGPIPGVKLLPDSLVQLSVTRSLLKLTLASPDYTLTKEFPIDLNRYAYRFDAASGNLTKKKTSRFSVYPYVEYKIRPFNIFTDLSGGLQVKTKSFNYKLGISLSYYPTISKKLYKDLEFSFTYNF